MSESPPDGVCRARADEQTAIDAEAASIAPEVRGARHKQPRSVTYCEGAPKPLFRGALHFLALVTVPWWGRFILHAPSLGASSTCHAVSSIQVVCVATGFALSVGYHRIPWSTPENELRMRRVDLMGIVLTIVGIATPSIALGLHIVARSLLACVWIGGLALCIAIGMDRFDPRLFLAFGSFIVVTGVFEAIHTHVLLASEWKLLALCTSLHVLSFLTYLRKWCDFFPRVWASHESFHFFSLLGLLVNSAFNLSLVHRLCS